jgi:hypothetical protein
MLSPKRFSLFFALASSAVLSLPLASAQNAESQQPTPASASQRVRSFGVKYLESFERVSPNEIEPRLQKRGLLPLIEKPYDQSKVDLVKTEITQIYKGRGVAVGARSGMRRSGAAIRIARSSSTLPAQTLPLVFHLPMQVSAQPLRPASPHLGATRQQRALLR